MTFSYIKQLDRGKTLNLLVKNQGGLIGRGVDYQTGAFVASRLKGEGVASGRIFTGSKLPVENCGGSPENFDFRLVSLRFVRGDQADLMFAGKEIVALVGGTAGIFTIEIDFDIGGSGDYFYSSPIEIGRVTTKKESRRDEK